MAETHTVNPRHIDVAQKMIDALLSVATPVVKERPTLYDQKLFSQRYIDSLTLEQRMEIANIIKISKLQHAVCDFNEGTILDLNKLSEREVAMIYDFIRSKIR